VVLTAYRPQRAGAGANGTVADETGSSEVTVTVGAAGNGGFCAFDPPAVRVEPGANVVWEWTGKGGQHNVVHEAGDFESDGADGAGAGGDEADGGGDAPRESAANQTAVDSLLAMLGLGFLSPIAFALLLRWRSRSRGPGG